MDPGPPFVNLTNAFFPLYSSSILVPSSCSPERSTSLFTSPGFRNCFRSTSPQSDRLLRDVMNVSVRILPVKRTISFHDIVIVYILPLDVRIETYIPVPKIPDVCISRHRNPYSALFPSRFVYSVAVTGDPSSSLSTACVALSSVLTLSLVTSR